MSGQQHAPAALYPQERTGTHFTEGWVGPRAGLDRCGKSRPHRDWIPDRPARSSVAIPTELPIQVLLLRANYRQYAASTKSTLISDVNQPEYGSRKQSRFVSRRVIHVLSLHSRRGQTVAYPGILLGGGVQQIQARTEDRENGDLGAVAS